MDTKKRIVIKVSRRSVLGFMPTNERICSLKMKGTQYNLNVRQRTMKQTGSVMNCRIPARKSQAFEDFKLKFRKEKGFQNVFGRYSLHQEISRNGLKIAQTI